MSFRCVIVTPEQQVLDETVRQVILPAHDGQIGILTDRAPLLVKLGLGPLQIDLPSGQRQSYYVEGGIAQMKKNRLTVLTNESVPSDQIDGAAAKAAFTEAAAVIPTDDQAAEQRDRRMQRARVMQEMAAAR
jgi:F-type H+-transporting ATPase subunit epsilon